MASSLPNEKDLIATAYKAVTLTTPTAEILNLLNSVGIKRSLEVLLIMHQSPKKVYNPFGFIKRAIYEGWTPATIPEKVDRRRERIEESLKNDDSFPFYNWVEGK